MTVNLDLKGDLAIYQGATFDNLILKLEGDYTNSSFRAEIRDKPLEKDGQVLASFSFVVTHEIEDGNPVTYLTPFLSYQQTSSLPSTKYQSGREIDNRNAWVWDLEAFSNLRVDKIVSLSFVQVVPEATN